MNRPQRHIIPEHLTRPSNAKTALLLFKSVALWIIPGLISWLLLRNLEVTNLLTGIEFWGVLLFCGFMSGNGLHTLGLLGHEGTHFSLHRKRRVSALIGMFSSSAVPLHLDMGFALSHARHHKYANTAKDPDTKVFSQFKTVLSRMFLARSAASREYLKLAFNLATKRIPKNEETYINLPYEELVMLARLNFLTSATFLALYIFILISNPFLFVTIVLMPVLMGILISGLRPYIEHTDTGTGRFDNARSWISPVFDFLYAGVNYHLAHHLYPGVASYNLPELQKWLESTGQVTKETSQIATTWAEVFESVRSKHQYPDGSI